jgi:hypothetical protein
MAERLGPLVATQGAWVRFPGPARPTFRVEKKKKKGQTETERKPDIRNLLLRGK